MEKGQGTNPKHVAKMTKEKQEAAMKVQTSKNGTTGELATGHQARSGKPIAINWRLVSGNQDIVNTKVTSMTHKVEKRTT